MKGAEPATPISGPIGVLAISSRLTLELYAQSVARRDRGAAEALGQAFIPEKQ